MAKPVERHRPRPARPIRRPLPQRRRPQAITVHPGRPGRGHPLPHDARGGRPAQASRIPGIIAHALAALVGLIVGLNIGGSL